VTAIALVVAAAWSLPGCKPTSTAEPARRPNILLIVADDLGFSDVGPYGGEISTPALDQLAKEGVQLSNFHVLPTCSPTRSVLLSGMDNHRAGLGTMGEFVTPEMEGVPGYAGYLNFEVAALPEVMRRAGYHTYMAGKWHLGAEENTSPHARGFEETFVLLQGGGSHWSDRKPLTPPEAMVYRRNGKEVESLPEDFYSSRYYTDRILEWIEQSRSDDKPFFTYLSYTAPHDPLHAPKEYIAKYEGKYDQGWDELRQTRLASLKRLGMVSNDAVPFPRLPNVKAWDELPPEERQLAARDMEVYAAMVDYLDEQIARIFDYLKEIGEYDNTMILFMSLPMQGQSVLDLLSGKSGKAYAGASRVGYELFSFKAFIDGTWKIVRMPKPLGTDEWELFDLSRDAAENRDLSAEQPDKLEEMVALWNQYREENGVLDIVPGVAK
jgi:arylsulfatase